MSIKFRNFERKAALEWIFKFCDFFSIIQYLDCGIPYALLCLACFRFSHIKRNLEDN